MTKQSWIQILIQAPSAILVGAAVAMLVGLMSRAALAAPVFVEPPVVLAASFKKNSASSGFFQDETLYLHAQDQLTTQLWFCTRQATLGTHCVAAPIILQVSWLQAPEPKKLALNQIQAITQVPEKIPVTTAIAALTIPNKSFQKESGIQSKITVAAK